MYYCNYSFLIEKGSFNEWMAVPWKRKWLQMFVVDKKVDHCKWLPEIVRLQVLLWSISKSKIKISVNHIAYAQLILK